MLSLIDHLRELSRDATDRKVELNLGSGKILFGADRDIGLLARNVIASCDANKTFRQGDLDILLYPVQPAELANSYTIQIAEVVGPRLVMQELLQRFTARDTSQLVFEPAFGEQKRFSLAGFMCYACSLTFESGGMQIVTSLELSHWDKSARCGTSMLDRRALEKITF